MCKYNLEYIKKNNLVLLEAIGGSRAYGTQTPTSDTDIRGVFICEQDDLYSGNYPDQINDKLNDIVFYELNRFMSLVSKGNPNILELLNTPEDCIISKHPLFDLILGKKNEFITKSCKNSFGGYARQQIVKAKGLNKKQNWEKDKVSRKEVLDFVYVIIDEKSIPWKVWNRDGDSNCNYEEKFIGITNVPNARDVYAMYYDVNAEMCHSERYDKEMRDDFKNALKKDNLPMGLGYKGLIKVGGDGNYGESNQLRLSSIPKGENTICNVTYNKDSYSTHCRDYKEYQEWLENRNEQRYVDTQKHGQQIDGKNMMHCIRLIRMSQEIGSGKGIIVRRDDSEYLLSIRRGEVNLDALINEAELGISEMNKIFKNSNLPDSVDKDLVNDLLVEIRQKFYND